MAVRCIFLICTVIVLAFGQAGGDFRLRKALSARSGKVVGSKMELADAGNRFVFPNDKSFVVYFEFDGPVGDHVLSGIWKGPDGRTISISPDIKLQTTARDFSAYWTYEITPGLPSGIWTLEIRIDGQPAGSHSFELHIPAPEQPAAPAPAPAAPALPTPDEIYKSARPSIVWIHRLDSTGRRVSRGAGFVLATDRVATAFQNIDAATSLEVEFEDGRRVASREISAVSRLQDWAVIRVATGTAKPLPRGDVNALAIAERLMVFNVETGRNLAFGGIDLSGKRTVPVFGERLQLSPPFAAEAAGGPLLNPAGRVVGILGGSITPGARYDDRVMSVSPSLFFSAQATGSAIPIHLVPEVPAAPERTLDQLREGGLMSAEVSAIPAFQFAGTSSVLAGNVNASLPPGVSDFSRKDAAIWVYSLWQKRDKTSKGMISSTVYDATNRIRVKVAPKKLSLDANAPMRVGFSFPPRDLEAGIYRVDLEFDGRPVWRTFVTISD